MFSLFSSENEWIPKIIPYLEQQGLKIISHWDQVTARFSWVGKDWMQQAQKEKKNRNHWVETVIYWELCKQYGFNNVKKRDTFRKDSWFKVGWLVDWLGFMAYQPL